MRVGMLALLALVILAILPLQANAQASGQIFQALSNPKVSPLLLDELRKSGHARAIVVLESDSLIGRRLEELSQSRSLSGGLSPEGFRAEVKAALEYVIGAAAASQEPVVRALEAMGVKVLDRLWLVDGIVVSAGLQDLQKIAGLPGVRGVYPDYVFKLVKPVAKIYLDRGEGLLAPLDNTSRRVVQADLVEALGINGSGVKVAILDTGIQVDHPWLLRNGTSVVKASYDATLTGVGNLCTYLGIPAEHGTHVAGIVASQDSVQRGVAPGADIYNVVVFSNITPYNCELAASSWIIRGIQWALVGPDGRPGTGDEADVISMSLGAVLPPWFTAYVAPQIPLIQAEARAVLAGVPVVVAAGNDGPGGYTINFLCLAPGVICVGASDSRRGSVASSYVIDFSSRGPIPFDIAKPDIAAPGVAIVSSIPYNRTAAFSGTSMATPHVSGIVALLKQARPDWGVSDIKRALVESGSLMTSSQIYGGPNPMEQGGGLAAALNSIRTPIRLSLVRGTDYGLSQTVILSPGSSATVQLVVSNIGSSGAAVSLSTAGFESYGGFSKLPSGSITFSPSSLDIAPGNISTVSVSIRIPGDVPPGTYSGYLVASSGDYSAKASLAVVVKASFSPTRLGAGATISGVLGFGPPEWIIYRLTVPQPPADIGIVSIASGLPAPARIYMIAPSGSFISASGGVKLSEPGDYLLIVETSDLALPEIFNLTLEAPGISGLASRVSIISSNISQLASLLASHEALISSLRDGLSSLNTSLATLSGQVDTQGAVISSLGRSLEDLSASLSDLSARFDEALSRVNIRIDSLSSGLSGLNSTFTSFQQSATASIQELRGGLSDLQQRLASFQQSVSADLQGLRSSIASLSTGLASLNTSFTSTSSELRAMIGQSSTYALAGIGIGAAGLVLAILGIVMRRRG